MRCSACNVALLSSIPAQPAPEYEDLVTVYEGDSSGASVARATIEGAGIESWVKDEEVHGIFPSLGSSEILVCAGDEQQALKALETPEPRPHRPHGCGHSASS